MPRKKKYPKLPNGFGQIKVYGGNRRKPVAAFPPATERTCTGEYKQPKPLTWCTTYLEAFSALDQYNRERGWYDKAVPSEIALLREEIATLRKALGICESENKYWNYTFSQVYEDYYETKYNGGKIYSKSSKNSTRAAYRNCAALHDRIFRELDQDDLQAVLDNCGLKHASQELIVNLYTQMYHHAGRYNILKQDYSRYVEIKIPDDDEPGVPFTEQERMILWDNREDEIVEFIIIMCLSGYRVSAYRKMTVNLDEQYFFGGVKTKNGKNRYVPIHPIILPYVRRRIEKYGCLLPITPQAFRGRMYDTLERIGIAKHTPHDTRDTFATLADKYRVDKTYLKRLMGHSLANDITEDKYINPALDDLRTEICKIQFP